MQIWTRSDDSEFRTRLIGENDDAGVQKESVTPQKIQQVMEPSEKTKELPISRRGETLDASEDQQGSQKKSSEKADDERTGFGWKGLGSRVIRFDENT